MFVPEHVQDMLADAGTNAAAAGREHAKRLMAEAREKAAGIYVVAPFRTPERALRLFEE
jgi:hypothetical protein